MNIAIFRPDLNLAATIQDLQTDDVLQILAEPNLMTESGKEATFLAGGEFPYPVIQSTGAAGALPAITIQFKDYGVRLNFTPIVTAGRHDPFEGPARGQRSGLFECADHSRLH